VSLKPLDRRFAEWVAGFMRHMHWSAKDLGAAVGVDRVTVSRWKNARTYPDRDMRLRLNDLAREEGYDAVPRRWG
jgi:transcriptional regulator with XRE-family HTH domain